MAWTTQIKVEAERKRSISAYIKEIKEVLKSKYASAANTFHDDLNRISVSLAGLEGELEAQLDSVRNLILKLEPLKGDLNVNNFLGGSGEWKGEKISLKFNIPFHPSPPTTKKAR